ncbi:hypothetical protein PSPHG_CDS_0119 [Pseudomonas phage Psxphi15]
MTKVEKWLIIILITLTVLWVLSIFALYIKYA